jgi:hypothetical protein
MAGLVVGGGLGAGYPGPYPAEFPSIVPGSGPFHNLGEKIFEKFSGKGIHGAFGPPVNYEKFMPALALDFEL